MGAEDIQLNEQTTAPMHLGSGKQPLPISKLNFSYNGMNHSYVLPLALLCLVNGTELPSLKKHSKHVLLFQTCEEACKIILFHISEKQHIACLYNQGKHCQFTVLALKHSEASWINRESKPMIVQQPLCLCAQESKPCLFSY